MQRNLQKEKTAVSVEDAYTHEEIVRNYGKKRDNKGGMEGFSGSSFDAKNFNSVKGITLIALVITIVVMLILTGITINMIFGDNGIFSKAKATGIEHTRGELQEQLRMEYQAKKIDDEEYGFRTFLEYMKNEKGYDITLPVGEEVVEGATITKKYTYTIELRDGNIYLTNSGGKESIAPDIIQEIATVKKSKKIEVSIKVKDSQSGFGKVDFFYRIKNEQNTTESILGLGGVQGETEEQNITADVFVNKGGTYEIYAEVYDADGNMISTEETPKEVEVTPPNQPKITQGMIPVKYKDNNWVICTESDPEWYDYFDSKWANMMLMDGTKVYNQGTTGTVTTISKSNLSSNTGKVISTLGSMYVWIPRYNYRIIAPAEGENNGEVYVDFLTQSYDKSGGHMGFTNFFGYVYPGYGAWYDSKSSNGMAGFWVAKFEPSCWSSATTNITATSSMNSNSTTYKARTVPGYSSWRNMYIGYAYTICRNITGGNASFYGLTSDLDQSGEGKAYAHLIKNSEWGAVALLTHSGYGRNRVEVSKNNNSNYITGSCTKTPDANEANTSAVTAGEEDEFCTTLYGSSIGVNASTTGNITGVYDFSGGASEFISIYNKQDNDGYLTTYKWTEQTKLTVDSDSTKYTTKGRSTSTSSNPKLYYDAEGSAIYEIYATGKKWFGDNLFFVTSSYPFLIRGGINSDTYGAAGIFTASNCSGNNSVDRSFRPTIMVED